MAQDDSWKDQPAPSVVSGVDKKTGQPYSVHIETPEPIRTGGGSKMTVPAGDLRDVGSAAEDFKTSQPSLKAIFGGKGPAVTYAGGAGTASPQQANDAISSLMQNLNMPLDKSIMSAGITPVPGGRSTTIPPGIMTPPTPFQERPMNTRPVVGAGNARARGIANAFTGVVNAVGAVTSAKAKQQHDTISVATTRLMEAQQGINQAEMALRSAPQGSPQAKEAQDLIEKNKTIMNTLLSDDKIRKGIEKGMDISFTDPSKNKTPEHGAVEAGRSNFAEQFSKQLPQQMQIDPAAAQRMQLALQQRTMDQKLLQTMLPKILSASSSMERTRYIQGMQNQRLISEQQFRVSQMSQKFMNDKYMKGLMHTYKLDENYKNIAWTGQKLIELHQADRLDPVNIFNEKNKFTENMIKNEVGLSKAMTDVQRDIDAARIELGKPGIDKGAINQTIQEAQYKMQGLQVMYDNLQKEKAYVYNQFGAIEAQSKQMAGAGGVDAGSSTFSGTPGSADGGAGVSGTPYDQTALGFGLSFVGTPTGAESESDESEDNESD